MTDAAPAIAPAAAAEPMPPAVKFVLAVIFANAIGFGIAMPVMPALVMELAGASIAQATAIGGLLALVYAGAQFLFSPLMGNLSDRFGRRPVLLASVAGFSVDFLILAFAPTLAWVFVVRILAGIFGASNAPAQSVIADVVPPDQRARYFGLISAAFGAGFVIGPALGGLLGGFGHRVPFLVAGALAALTFAYGWLRLPETLAPGLRRSFDWRRANPLGSLLQARKLKGVGAIATVLLFWQVATLVYPSTWSYFTIARYGWSPQMVGLSLGGIGMLMVAVQIWVLPWGVARWGEHGTAIRGVALAALAMLGLGAATQSWMACALYPLIAMQSLVHANLMAMISRSADARTQGEVQGFASAVMAVGSLAAPALYNPLMSWFMAPAAPVQVPGIAYLLAGSIGMACLPILLAMPKARP